MSEGGIYLCNWAESNGEYSLQLRANPQLTAEGADLERCMEDICLQIIDWNGDGEAVLELFPPQGGSPSPGAAILFAQLGYNDSVGVADYETLFEGGACPICKFGLDGRSGAAIHVTSKPKGTACAADGCYPILMMYKKEFVDLLSDDERASIEMRTVLFDGKETGYVELIASDSIPAVGYRGAEYPTAFQQSFKCSECGREKFIAEVDGFEYGTRFIDATSIDANPATMIATDDGWRESLAFRLGRWQELLEQAGRRGLSSDALAVLEPDLVEHPVLESCSEFDWVM